MAEIVGLAASIVGLIAATGKVYGFLATMKKAPSEMRELIKELDSLNTALDILKKIADKYPESEALNTLNSSDPNKPGPLQECSQELQVLMLKLEPKKGRLESLKRRFGWPLREAETSQIIARLERHKNLFVLAISADHIDRTIQDLKNTNKKEKRKKVLDWIYSGGVEAKHLEITRRRRKNTGGWILRSTEFKEWTLDPDSRILWAHGIPGAGKTFLSSIVINYFEGLAETANYGVAYIYLDYTEQTQQKPILVLASLVRQLAYRVLQLPEELEALHDKLEPLGRSATIKDLYTTLLKITKKFPQVYLIFDALDECDQGKQRKELLPLFNRMGNDGIKLFVTSRPHPEDIRVSFKDTAKVKILEKEEDIESYIQQKIDENPKAKRLVRDGKCEDKIISELINCAKGMFLLVRFHIEYICQQTTTNQLLAALDRLRGSSTELRPLDPIYDRVMEKIRGQPKACADLALKVLIWIVKARRALTIKELQIAVSIELGQHKLDQLDFPDEKTLLDVCASLIVIDETSYDRTIRLAHYTVQEYLLAKSIIPEHADLNIITACTTYIALDAFKNKIYTGQERLDSFVGYAFNNLKAHLDVYDEGLTMDLILNFAKCEGRSYYASFYLYHKTSRLTYLKKFTPLQLASLLGHSAVVQRLLDETADTPGKDRFLTLVYAIITRQKNSIQLLLNHWCSNLVSMDTELVFTELYGGYKIIRLVEDSDGISAQNNDGRTPLHLVSMWGISLCT